MVLNTHRCIHQHKIFGSQDERSLLDISDLRGLTVAGRISSITDVQSPLPKTHSAVPCLFFGDKPLGSTDESIVIEEARSVSA